MKTKIFKAKDAPQSILDTNQFIIETGNVVVNCTTFYDRLNEMHTTVVCYYN